MKPGDIVTVNFGDQMRLLPSLAIEWGAGRHESPPTHAFCLGEATRYIHELYQGAIIEQRGELFWDVAEVEEVPAEVQKLAGYGLILLSVWKDEHHAIECSMSNQGSLATIAWLCEDVDADKLSPWRRAISSVRMN